MSDLSALNVLIELHQFRRAESIVFRIALVSESRVLVAELRHLNDDVCQRDAKFRCVFENCNDSEENDDGDDDEFADDAKKLEIVYRRLVDGVPQDSAHQLQLPLGLVQALFSTAKTNNLFDGATTTKTTAAAAVDNAETLEGAMRHVLSGIRQLEQRVKNREESLVRREAEMLQQEKATAERIAAQSAERLAKTKEQCDKQLADAEQSLERTKKEVAAMKQQIQLERNQWEEAKQMIAKTQRFGEEKNSRVKISVGEHRLRLD